MNREKNVLLVLVMALVLITGQVVYAQPTATNMVGWWKADAGVMDSNDLAADEGDVVVTWLDSSGGGHDGINNGTGTMELATATFPAGDLPVIRFHDDGWFDLVLQEDFRLSDLTVYAVIENTGSGRQTYFSTYSNAEQYGFGYNCDFTGTQSRIFTSNGNGVDPDPISVCYSDWLTPVGSSVDFHLITNIIDGEEDPNVSLGGVKTVFVDGCDETDYIGQTDFPCLGYIESCPATIGSLGALGLFNFNADIAEILVYASAGEEKLDVEAYLLTKYGIVDCSLECGDWGYYHWDVDQSCVVDLPDIAALAADWLKCTDPDRPAECDNLIIP